MTEDNNQKFIPYWAYEATQARNERTIKRLIIALIVAIALIFASNAIWIYAWMQYDHIATESSVDLSTDGGGDANYIGNDGDINNGTSKSENDNTQESAEKR